MGASVDTYVGACVCACVSERVCVCGCAWVRVGVWARVCACVGVPVPRQPCRAP